MKSLGKSVTEFKKGVAGIEDDIDSAVTADKKPAATATTSTDLSPRPTTDPAFDRHRPIEEGGRDAMFGNLNPMEMMVVMGVAVLLFGKRLPEVGRTLGKGIVEFKKGIRGIEEEFRFDEHSTRNSYQPRADPHPLGPDRVVRPQVRAPHRRPGPPGRPPGARRHPGLIRPEPEGGTTMSDAERSPAIGPTGACPRWPAWRRSRRRPGPAWASRPASPGSSGITTPSGGSTRSSPPGSPPSRSTS